MYIDIEWAPPSPIPVRTQPKYFIYFIRLSDSFISEIERIFYLSLLRVSE